MKIGALAQVASTPIETIRYYEREGLLPPPARTSGNFRTYEPAHLERLQFIRHCRSLDMSLDEVRVLLRVKDQPGDDCADVNAVLDSHIGHVSQRIRALRALERQLKALRSQCGGAQAPDACGILHGLSQGPGEVVRTASDAHPMPSVHRR